LALASQQHGPHRRRRHADTGTIAAMLHGFANTQTNVARPVEQAQAGTYVHDQRTRIKHGQVRRVLQQGRCEGLRKVALLRAGVGQINADP